MSTTELSDRDLCVALRDRDEAAFSALVERYHLPLKRLALAYVSSEAVAEEVVQETWLGVVRGIDRFEGRSSLKTWIYQILTNIAKTRGAREKRTVPLSSLELAVDDPAVDPSRFLDEQHEKWPGHWAAPPARWDELPEECLTGRETLETAQRAISNLPTVQRQVIVLRDIEGWEAEDVCALLDLSQANQRVLLHRARSKVRQVLEDHLAAATV
jgi:RNA polymerase sigma-70 factor (ECF subfamily)